MWSLDMTAIITTFTPEPVKHHPQQQLTLTFNQLVDEVNLKH